MFCEEAKIRICARPIVKQGGQVLKSRSGLFSEFVMMADVKTEICGPCQKKIKVGKSCYKCYECRMAAHPECRDKAPLPCVPCESGTKTPSKAGQGYT